MVDEWDLKMTGRTVVTEKWRPVLLWMIWQYFRLEDQHHDTFAYT